jgi:hypothetical protein
VNETVTAAADATAAAMDVVLAETEPNVLAGLLKQHIDAIIAADPAKIDAARKIRGKLGLNSTEPEAQVTLVFDGRGVTIKNGMDADRDGTITGPLKLQTETLIGVANPYREMLRRKLKVGIKPSRPLFTAQTYAFLKVPPSLRPKPEQPAQ